MGVSYGFGLNHLQHAHKGVNTNEGKKSYLVRNDSYQFRYRKSRRHDVNYYWSWWWSLVPPWAWTWL